MPGKRSGLFASYFYYGNCSSVYISPSERGEVLRQHRCEISQPSYLCLVVRGLRLGAMKFGMVRLSPLDPECAVIFPRCRPLHVWLPRYELWCCDDCPLSCGG